MRYNRVRSMPVGFCGRALVSSCMSRVFRDMQPKHQKKMHDRRHAPHSAALNISERFLPLISDGSPCPKLTLCEMRLIRNSARS